MIIDSERLPSTIFIGRTGENEFRPVEISVSTLLAKYPNANFYMVFHRPDGQIYPLSSNVINNVLTWIPTDIDLAFSGNGQLEFRLMLNGIIGKSAIINTITEKSLDPAGVVPQPPTPDWIQTVLNAADQVENNVDGFDAHVVEKTTEFDNNATEKQALVNAKAQEADQSAKDAQATADGLDITKGYDGTVYPTAQDRLIGDMTNAYNDLDSNRMMLPYSGTSIDALDSLVGYTEDLTVNGFSIAGELENGDFSDGTNGWYANSATFSAINGILSIVGNGADAYPQVVQYGDKSVAVGEKWFIYAKHRLINEYTGNAYLGLAFQGIPAKLISNPIVGQWYENFYIRETTQNITIRTSIYHQYADATTANGKTMEIDGNAGVYAINMTKYGIEDYTEQQMLNIVHGMQSGTNIQSCILSEVKSVGKNLFDKSTTIDGFRIKNTDGTFAVGSTMSATDYIIVKPNENYCFSGFNYINGTQHGAFYDINKNFISGFYSTIESGNSPLSAKYLRYSVPTADKDTFQLEQGSTPTDYAEYVLDAITIDPPVTLRGLPNSVADTVNGDVVTRNVGSRAYQAGDESNPDYVTDMTTTLYALTTPETEIVSFSELQTYPEATHIMNDSGIPCDMAAKVPTDMPKWAANKTSENAETQAALQRETERGIEQEQTIADQKLLISNLQLVVDKVVDGE